MQGGYAKLQNNPLKYIYNILIYDNEKRKCLGVDKME